MQNKKHTHVVKFTHIGVCITRYVGVLYTYKEGNEIRIGVIVGRAPRIYIRRRNRKRRRGELRRVPVTLSHGFGEECELSYATGILDFKFENADDSFGCSV